MALLGVEPKQRSQEQGDILDLRLSPKDTLRGLNISAMSPPRCEKGGNTTDENFDIMMKTMKRLIDRSSLDNRPPNIDKIEPQIKNPNFRRPPPPHIRQRGKISPRNVEDQEIRPPFIENFVDE